MAALGTLVGCSSIPLGDEDRYTAESDDMQTLLNQVGGEDVLVAGTQEEVDDGTPSFGQFEGQVGIGYGATFDGETTDLTYAVVFDDADDVDADDVEEFVEDATDALDFIESFEDVEGIESTQNGRTAVVSGTMDTDEYGT